MTRDRLNKHWDLIQKFKNGEDIQYENENGEWIDVENPLFHLDSIYRIKPKQEYIPFDFSDAEYLILKSVRNKDEIDSYISIILSVDIGGVTLPGRYLIYDSLFKDYTFLDGSPCGKLKQQL